MPLVASACTTTESRCVARAEPRAPGPDRLVADDDAALGDRHQASLSPMPTQLDNATADLDPDRIADVCSRRRPIEAAVPSSHRVHVCALGVCERRASGTRTRATVRSRRGCAFCRTCVLIEL